MNPAATKLIADRGHGLTRAQRAAIRWLATEGREGASPRRHVTWESLERLGLVENHSEIARYIGRGYSLTDDGRCLALCMGMTQPGPVTDSPGDMYDSHELEPRDLAELARRADELLAQENAGITESWREDR